MNKRYSKLYVNIGSTLVALKSSPVAQLCPTLCDPMDCRTPGLPVHQQLLEFTQTHVHWVSDAMQPSQPLIPFSSHFQSFPASGSFQMSQFFASGDQRTGVSASASVLPMNTQGWSPLGWTGWISLQSKGLSRVWSSTTVQKHQFSAMSDLAAPWTAAHQVPCPSLLRISSKFLGYTPGKAEVWFSEKDHLWDEGGFPGETIYPIEGYSVAEVLVQAKHSNVQLGLIHEDTISLLVFIYPSGGFPDGSIGK